MFSGKIFSQNLFKHVHHLVLPLIIVLFNRFRFLVVKDVESNPRLQLGSIDLYAKGS